MSTRALSLSDLADAEQFLLFQVNGWRLALPLDHVRRVLPVVEAMPLPGAPPLVAGIIHVDGAPVPVADLREVLGAPLRKVQAKDVLILTTTPTRQIALWVDDVEGMISLARENLLQARPLLGENRVIRRVASQAGDLILIYDLEEMLSCDEDSLLADALAALAEQV